MASASRFSNSAIRAACSPTCRWSCSREGPPPAASFTASSTFVACSYAACRLHPAVGACRETAPHPPTKTAAAFPIHDTMGSLAISVNLHVPKWIPSPSTDHKLTSFPRMCQPHLAPRRPIGDDAQRSAALALPNACQERKNRYNPNLWISCPIHLTMLQYLREIGPTSRLG